MKLISSRFLSLAVLADHFRLTSCDAVAQTEKPTPRPLRALRGDPLHVFSQSIQALTAKVTKSVVQIVATGYGFSSGKAGERYGAVRAAGGHRRRGDPVGGRIYRDQRARGAGRAQDSRAVAGIGGAGH